MNLGIQNELTTNASQSLMASRTFFYIAMPCYERAELTIRALDSLLKQQYENYRIIVCNDGSQEDYSEIEKIAKNNTKIVYLKNTENLGLNKTVNKIFDFCFEEYNIKEDDYIFLLDNDDYLIDENVLSLFDQEIKKLNFPKWLCFNCKSKTLNNKIFEISNYTEYLKYTYIQYRKDYRGDKHHVFNLKGIENIQYTTLYKNGYEHIFYFKLPYKIHIVPKTVKVIQYYENGLSHQLYKETTLEDVIKHIREMPFKLYSYKMILDRIHPKEIIKLIIGAERYYAMKSKLGLPHKRK